MIAFASTAVSRCLSFAQMECLSYQDMQRLTRAEHQFTVELQTLDQADTESLGYEKDGIRQEHVNLNVATIHSCS